VVQLGAIPPSAGRRVFVHSCAAGRFEGTDLGGGVLIAGLGHAGVAEQHGGCRAILLPLITIGQQGFARRKPLFLLAPVFRRADDDFRNKMRLAVLAPMSLLGLSSEQAVDADRPNAEPACNGHTGMPGWDALFSVPRH